MRIRSGFFNRIATKADVALESNIEPRQLAFCDLGGGAIEWGTHGRGALGARNVMCLQGHCARQMW